MYCFGRLVILLLVTLISGIVSGQNTFTSVSNGNWTDISTWSCGGCGVYPGRISNADIVIIRHSVALNSASSSVFLSGATFPTISSLTINSNSSSLATLQIGGSSSPTASDGNNTTGRSLLITGDLTVGSDVGAGESVLHLYDNATVNVQGNSQISRTAEDPSVGRVLIYHYAHLTVGTSSSPKNFTYNYDVDVGTTDTYEVNTSEIRLGNGSSDDLGQPKLTVYGNLSFVQESIAGNKLDVESSYNGLISVYGNYFQSINQSSSTSMINVRLRRYSKLNVYKSNGTGGNLQLFSNTSTSARNRIFLNGTASGGTEDVTGSNGIISIEGDLIMTNQLSVGANLNSNIIRVFGDCSLVVNGNISNQASASSGAQSENQIELHQSSVLELKGNVSNSTQGRFNFETSGAGSSTKLKLSGSVAQLIDYSLVSGTFYRNIEINNSSISGVTLGGSITVNDATVTLTQGLLNTTSINLLILGRASSSTGNSNTIGSSATSFISGPVRKQCGTLCSNTTFYVGKSGRAAPLAIENLANFNSSTTFTAEYFSSSYSVLTTNGVFPQVSTLEYWNLSVSGLPPSSPSPDILLNWKDACYSQILDQSNLLVSKYNGAVWTDIPSSIQPGSFSCPSAPLISGSIKGTGVPLTVGSNFLTFGTTDAFLNPLPITLKEFKGSIENGKVNLTWITESELNSDYYRIERSKDGFNFEKIGEVTGAGTTTNRSYYQFIDDYPVYGRTYYSVKQLDFDHQENSLGIVVLNNEIIPQQRVSLSPMPIKSNESFNLSLTNLDESIHNTFNVLSFGGQYHISGTLEKVYSNLYTAKLPASLEPGIYIFQFFIDDTLVPYKVFIK